MTDEQIKLLSQIQELHQKGIFTDAEFAAQKKRIIGEQIQALSVDESAFTMVISAPESRAIFDEYNLQREKIRKGFINKYVKKRRYFTFSVDKRIKRFNAEGERISGSELISKIGRELRDQGFNVDECSSHLKVHQNGLEFKSGAGYKGDVFGIVTFIAREQSWEIQSRFDLDIYESKMEQIAVFVGILIISVFFWPCLCALGGLSGDEKARKEEAKKFIVTALETAMKSFSTQVV